MKNMTRTFVRTRDTMDRYHREVNERRSKGIHNNPFMDWKDKAIKEFEHWVIIPNEYPYDAISTVNHMIATKRPVAFDWRLLNPEEEKEIEFLKETYINEHYDVVWENLPKGQTVPGHFHLHLLVLKREEM